MKALAVFGVVAFLLTANGMLTAGLPLGWRAIGFPAQDIAWLAACGYAGVLLGGFVNPSIVRAVGCRRGYLMFVALFAVGCAGFLLPASIVVYGAARVTAGCAIAGLYLLIESRLNAIARPASRARLLSTYMVVLYVAQATGANLATSGPIAGARMLPVAIALILFAALGLKCFPEMPVAKRERGLAQLRELLRTSPEGYAGGLAAGMLFGTFYGLGPVFAEAHLSAPARTGPLMATAMLGAVIGLLLAGKFAGAFRTTAGVACVALAGGASALAVAAGSGAGDTVLFALVAVFGAVAFPLYPLASACVNANVAPASRIAANGLYLLTSGIGGVVGPLCAGELLRVAGSAAPFIVVAASSLALALFVALRTVRSLRASARLVGAAGSISPTSGMPHG